MHAGHCHTFCTVVIHPSTCAWILEGAKHPMRNKSTGGAAILQMVLPKSVHLLHLANLEMLCYQVH